MKDINEVIEWDLDLKPLSKMPHINKIAIPEKPQHFFNKRLEREFYIV